MDAVDDGRVGCTLGFVLRELGPRARLVSGGDSALERTVSNASVWFEGDPVPIDAETLIACPLTGDTATRAALSSILSGPLRRMVAIPLVGELDPAWHCFDGVDHAVVALSPKVNVADVVAIVARAAQPLEESAARRILMLHRSLSHALADPAPMAALLTRLERTCHSTVALLDLGRRVVHSTGPLPLAVLHDQLSRSNASPVILDADGWRGIAHLVEDSLDDGRPFGWLVAVARRSEFPNPAARAAVEVAATLVETTRRISVVERSQERAIRSSVLEQALALRVERDDPELSGRIAGLGLRFQDELRMLVVRSVRTHPADRRRTALADLGLSLARTFRSAGVSEFSTVRGDHVAVLVQCSSATARRLLVTHDASSELQVGAGRRVATTSDIADSYNDAHLAVRALQRHPSHSGFVTFEDFDFATRLFSSVGLDKMVAWAQEFFRPLEGRDALTSAVHSYFAHGQNIKAAANHLSVHHNSLRYRLAKVEALLGVSFSDPAAISSTYLALTALDLVNDSRSPRIEASRTTAGPTMHDVVSSDSATDFRHRSPTDLGVVRGPDR